MTVGVNQFTVRSMSTRENLLREIEEFLKQTGMSPTTFGTKAVGDRALMISLRDGRDPKLSTVDKIRSFMAKERKARSLPNPKLARSHRAEAA